MAQKYSCAFSGQCEVDDYGTYDTNESCQADCHAVEDKESRLLTYEYAPKEGLGLAPSDHVLLIRRISGVTVPLDEARNVLRLINGDEKVYGLGQDLEPETRVQLVRYLTGATLSPQNAGIFLNELPFIDLRNRWSRFLEESTGSSE